MNKGPSLIHPSPAIIVMGVSGCGKTTVGKQLAERLGLRFLDADDFHPSANIAKMRAGIPLQDSDRAPWLDVLAQQLFMHRKAGVILACSALKQSYRDRLTSRVPEARFLYLKGSFQSILERIKVREHFMPESLLQSQFATLEEPENALVLEISQDPETLVNRAIQLLQTEA